jgi:membrane protein DedA with SNARE-associated domain
MIEWFQAIASNALQLLEQGSPLAMATLFLITALTELGMPFPLVQDTILLYVGYEPTGRLLWLSPLIVASLTVGRVFGASIYYWLSRVLGGRFTSWFRRKFPKIQANVDVLADRLGRKSIVAVAVARFTPGLLTAASVAAGIVRVNYGYFCLGIVLESIVADGAYVVAGVALRYGFTFLGFSPSPLVFAAGVVVVILVATLAAWLWRRHRHGKPTVVRV